MRILNFLTLSCSLFLLLYSGACFSQKIVSGPIQGHTTDTSAVFWVLTKNNLSFNIKENFSSPSYNVVIKEDTMCSAHLKNKKAYKYTLYFPTFKTPYAAQGKHSFYNYSVFLNGVKYNDYKITLSSQKDSVFMFGSCAYIGKGFSRVYRPWNMTKIFKTMSKVKTKNMLWMGDNVYLILNHDLKSTKSIYRRYVGVRKQKNMNKLLSSNKQHYSTWDDHDFGPNNTDGSYEKAALTTAAFNNFWVNPMTKNKKGIYYCFKKGDVSFFMTDSRTFKINGGSSLLGEEQLKWLKKELLTSKATLKVVILSNQLINAVEGHESYYDFERERSGLIDFINTKKIPGVVFFSGDRHHSEINVELDQNYYPIYDITCSALSSPRPKLRGWGVEGDIPTRIEGSFITKHNYGLLVLKNSTAGKSMVVRFVNKNGVPLYEHEIPITKLGY
jgi:alkaline phosphatase D